MGNSLRCFVACVLPCGALDLIRVVHINGHVEEYSRQVPAGEVLKSNPNHVLTKPCSDEAGGVHRIVVVSPDSDLKRGGIYFLVPKSSLPADPKTSTKEKNKKKKRTNAVANVESEVTGSQVVVSTGDGDGDGYVVADVLPERRPGHRRRRSSSARVGVWRPHLQSISEDL